MCLNGTSTFFWFNFPELTDSFVWRLNPINLWEYQVKKKLKNLNFGLYWRKNLYFWLIFKKPPLSVLPITFQNKGTKMFLLTSIVGLLLLLWTVIRSKKPKNFPPGPLKLPVVGSIPFIQGSGATPSLILGISKQVEKTPQNGVSLLLEKYYWLPRNALFTSATENIFNVKSK